MVTTFAAVHFAFPILFIALEWTLLIGVALLLSAFPILLLAAAMSPTARLEIGSGLVKEFFWLFLHIFIVIYLLAAVFLFAI